MPVFVVDVLHGVEGTDDAVEAAGTSFSIACKRRTSASAASVTTSTFVRVEADAEVVVEVVHVVAG
ncbi:hypothetical protein QA640_03290 [Bradyrhizobium sp. CB82]|uniref:hypothetical protein n=1 Tax=Bradyrhizobium sp. CB82 TaxID=3039159 RepID=UPI0024B154F6|nr:hypothetical protein [Bradyrhizobium sp. CB82]WFU41567.1 hypothetical protein QA640_03290 [Bradyrhizobium sp. CB82]